MSETISSPNGSLRVDLSLRRAPGSTGPAPFGRVRLGTRVVVGWSRLGGAVRSGRLRIGRRTLRAPSGELLAEELVLGRGSSSCVVRIADDALCLLPASPAVEPALVFPAALRSASVPTGASFSVLSPGLFRKRAKMVSPAVLAYAHGAEAVWLRDHETGAVLLLVGDGPASLLIPRGVRSLLSGLPASPSLAEAPSPIATAPSADTDFNVRYPFLVPEMALGELRRIGRRPEDFLDTDGLLSKRPPPFCGPLDVEGKATPCHLAAYDWLTRPGAADAATGYRGEFGEYLAGARRIGETWVVAGFTHKPRVLTLFFPYLEEGVGYRATWRTDGVVAKPGASDPPLPDEIRAGDKVIVKMAEGGGYVLTLVPRHR